MKYYIASPGFNDSQIKRIKEVESTLAESGVDFYSPFTHGGKLSLGTDTDLNKIKVTVMFYENIYRINECDKMIAIVDDFDKGTLFEIGYYYGHYNCSETNRGLLIIGKLAEEVNKELNKVIDRLYELEDKSLVDLTNKDSIITYLSLGYLYSSNDQIIGYLPKNLKSNVMTAPILTNVIIQSKDNPDFESCHNLLVKDPEVDFTLKSFLISSEIE